MADVCRLVGGYCVCVFCDAVGIVPTLVVLERIINACVFDKRTYTHAFEALQYVHSYLRSYIWAVLYLNTLYSV